LDFAPKPKTKIIAARVDDDLHEWVMDLVERRICTKSEIFIEALTDLRRKKDFQKHRMLSVQQSK